MTLCHLKSCKDVFLCVDNKITITQYILNQLQYLINYKSYNFDLSFNVQLFPHKFAVLSWKMIFFPPKNLVQRSDISVCCWTASIRTKLTIKKKTKNNKTSKTVFSVLCSYSGANDFEWAQNIVFLDVCASSFINI